MEVAVCTLLAVVGFVVASDRPINWDQLFEVQEFNVEIVERSARGTMGSCVLAREAGGGRGRFFPLGVVAVPLDCHPWNFWRYCKNALYSCFMKWTVWPLKILFVLNVFV